MFLLILPSKTPTISQASKYSLLLILGSHSAKSEPVVIYTVLLAEFPSILPIAVFPPLKKVIKFYSPLAFTDPTFNANTSGLVPVFVFSSKTT